MDGSQFNSTEAAFMPFHPVIGAFRPLQRPRRGIVAGTLLASKNGWCAVEDLAPGDLVQTFDNGMQPVAEICTETLWSEGQMKVSDPLPVVLPAGALNNQEPITVLPHQGVFLESENACDAMGNPFAVVPARVLVGISGITTVLPEKGLTVYTLTFAGEEVVYADGGLMLHCPAAAMSQDMAHPTQIYDVKTLVEARRMLTDLDIAQLVLDDEIFEIYEDAALQSVA